MNGVEATIISQYGNSAVISKLIHNMDEYIDPQTDINQFFSFVWDVSQAQGFGLDIWGRIVNVNREILTNPVYYLEDEPFRQLILLKALSNISASTAPSINQLLQNWMSGRGRCYVNDLGNMQMRYTFEFVLEPFEIVLITQGGIFLRPGAVGATIINMVFPAFGFSEMGIDWITPFDDAPFISEDSIHEVI
jgi:hypothetical protein